jgi:hypothetical protein
MASKPEAGAALETILDAKKSDELVLEHQATLAEYAGRILTAKAELVFSKSVIVGLGGGIIGGREETLLTRATMPLAIGESYVALRDSPEYPSKIIELLVVGQSDPKHLGQIKAGPDMDKSTLARFKPQLEIPSVKPIKVGHLEALSALLRHIDGSLEPLGEALENLPRLASNDEIRFIREGSKTFVNQRVTPIPSPFAIHMPVPSA